MSWLAETHLNTNKQKNAAAVAKNKYKKVLPKFVTVSSIWNRLTILFTYKYLINGTLALLQTANCYCLLTLCLLSFNLLAQNRQDLSKKRQQLLAEIDQAARLLNSTKQDKKGCFRPVLYHSTASKSTSRIS